MKNISKIFILSLAFMFFLTNKANAFSFDSKIKNAENFYNKKDYKKSVENYQKAQIESPKNDLLKYNLGDAEYKAGNFENAEKLFKSLTDSTKKSELKEKAWYNLGNTYYRQGKLEEAEKSYKEALKIDANDLQAKKNLEKVQEEIKKRNKDNQQRKQNKDNQNQQDKNNKEQNKDNQNQQDKNNKEQNKDNQNQQDKNNKEQNKDNQNQQDKNNKEQNKGNQTKEQQNKNKSVSPEETEKWLNAIEDNNKEIMKKQALKKVSNHYYSKKDW